MCLYFTQKLKTIWAIEKNYCIFNKVIIYKYNNIYHSIRYYLICFWCLKLFRKSLLWNDWFIVKLTILYLLCIKYFLFQTIMQEHDDLSYKIFCWKKSLNIMFVPIIIIILISNIVLLFFSVLAVSRITESSSKNINQVIILFVFVHFYWIPMSKFEDIIIWKLLICIYG